MSEPSIESSSGNPSVADFTAMTQAAIAQPASADFQVLWRWLEQVLAGLPQDRVLWVAGEAIAQLAELCAVRAEVLLESWQSRHNPPPAARTEPILTEDLLASVLRQTMSLNLEVLLEELEPQQRARRTADQEPEDSIAGDVDKAVVLEMLDQMEIKQATLHTAYEESISEWSAIVQRWIESQPQPVNLQRLLHHVELSPVRSWLGLLLTNPTYQWQNNWKTDAEFYCPMHTWIRSSNDLANDHSGQQEESPGVLETLDV